MLKFLRKNGLEGVIAKRTDSPSQPGKRTTFWSEHRINEGREFLVGGFTPGVNGFNALIIGFYRVADLVNASRVRAGFIPATRREVAARFKGLQIQKCPFVNLPQKDAGRWSQGLTADKMKECTRLIPKIIVRIDFLEWTGADHLRHTKFVALRDDKDPRKDSQGGKLALVSRDACCGAAMIKGGIYTQRSGNYNQRRQAHGRGLNDGSR